MARLTSVVSSSLLLSLAFALVLLVVTLAAVLVADNPQSLIRDSDASWSEAE